MLLTMTRTKDDREIQVIRTLRGCPSQMNKKLMISNRAANWHDIIFAVSKLLHMFYTKPDPEIQAKYYYILL